MKKLFLLSNFLLLTVLVSAQSAFALIEGQSALVYSLPKTEFCFEIVVEKVTEKPGIFYRYSQRYLAANKVITEESVNYRFKGVTVKTRAVADQNRTYSVLPSKKSPILHLSVNKNGILGGVNVACEPDFDVTNTMPESYSNEVASSDLLPLGEEYMMAGSEAKLAEGAAKQIYRIRESRLGILTADVEKLPADGASFKLMMDGLNKMEKDLTELFIGRTTSEIQTQRVYMTPIIALKNEVLFRLSAFNGVVPSTDLSGTPYYISIVPNASSIVGADSKENKVNSSFYYVQPVSSLVTIGDGVNVFYNNKFDVPQFGKVFSLPEEILKNPATKVKIDSQTGRLLSVE